MMSEFNFLSFLMSFFITKAVACCKAASIPQHYGKVVLQWLASIERKSLEILNYAIWEGSLFLSIFTVLIEFSKP